MRPLIADVTTFHNSTNSAYPAAYKLLDQPRVSSGIFLTSSCPLKGDEIPTLTSGVSWFDETCLPWFPFRFGLTVSPQALPSRLPIGRFSVLLLITNVVLVVGKIKRGILWFTTLVFLPGETIDARTGKH